jgi:hypothetical protein
VEVGRLRDKVGSLKSLEKSLEVEWCIKLFLGVHFAANWVSVH